MKINLLKRPNYEIKSALLKNYLKSIQNLYF